MTNFLFAKNKTDFVDGTLKKPEISSSEYKSWMRCDAMIKGWLTTAMEKGIRDSVKYANTSSEIWSDLKERFGKENKSIELGRNDTDKMVNVLSSMEAANILTSEVAAVSVSPVAAATTAGVPTESAKESCLGVEALGNTSALEEMNVKTVVKEGHVLEISKGGTSAPEEVNVKTVIKEGHVLEISERGTSAPEEVNVKTNKAPEEMNVRTVVKDDHVPEIFVKIGRQLLTVNTSPQQIQHNFLKRLLGSGFVVHMRENELLHDVFKFKPEKRKLGRELYVAERDEVGINLFVPDVIREENFRMKVVVVYTETTTRMGEESFTELLYQFLKAFKRSSAKESCLGVEALAINIGCGENGLELYKESAPILSEALNTKSNSKKLKLILDSLAIITFIGGNELEETERSMQSIWHFMHSRAHLKDAQSAAILSWSLLLSTMDSWSLNYKHWRGAIPFFKSLLEADHESNVVGARQALSLISELGCLEKFEGDTSALEEMKAETEVKENGYALEICEVDTSALEKMNENDHVPEISEGNKSAPEEMNVKNVVKENDHVPEISEGNTSAPEEMNVKNVVKISEGGTSAPEEVNVKTVIKDGHVSEISKCDTSAPEEMNAGTVVKDDHVSEISKCDTSAPEEMNAGTVVKDDHVSEISVKIGKQLLTVNTSPQQIQHNFLKRLLGSGFVVHMRENVLLHDVFKFKPEKQKLGRELYVAERDEVGMNLFVPEVIREENFRRIHNSQNSIFVKAKTQIRNKNRDIKDGETGIKAHNESWNLICIGLIWN
nr:hypothetical protein [Tanacetum cinerariifolium]